EGDDSGSDASCTVFSGVRPLFYQVVGSDPEFGKRCTRRLTHFCKMRSYFCALPKRGATMFCTQCGNEVETHARFCSKCGQEVTTAVAAAAPVQPKKARHDMDMHVNILGWLLIGCGILTAIGGMVLLFASEIIKRLPVSMAHEVPPGMLHLASWVTSV